ncbi:MAG TPA: PilZ domain-containing protein [Desulfobacterales bacterium]|nr:PilZ domain-containing protein [Desulfobacterales bacterium]
MEKDVAFSMRMNKRIRAALKRAAKKDRRTVSSLVDKVLTDYLMKEGFIKEPEIGIERRRFPRKKITLPAKASFKTESKEEVFSSVVLDISMGGALVSYPKGSKIKFMSEGGLPQFGLRLDLPKEEERLWFDCEARHMRDTGTEIEVGAVFSKSNGGARQKLSSYLMSREA